MGTKEKLTAELKTELEALAKRLDIDAVFAIAIVGGEVGVHFANIKSINPKKVTATLKFVLASIDAGTLDFTKRTPRDA